MKKIYLILLGVILPTIHFGQNYAPFFINDTTYFTTSEGNVINLQFESTAQNEDTLWLYPNKVILDGYYLDCFDGNISWLGKKSGIINDEKAIFINRENDTILIDLHAEVNDSWIAYEKANELIIKATVATHEKVVYDAIKDSVKTIHFQAYDNTMDPIGYPINDEKISLSKHFGMIEGLNFYAFPEVTMYNHSFTSLATPTKTAFENFTLFDVFDFQIGDELHIKKNDRSTNLQGYTVSTESIYTYTDRVNYEDSIVYHYEEKSRVDTLRENNPTSDFIVEVHKTVIEKDSLFNLLPGTPIIEDESYMYEYLVYQNDSSKRNTEAPYTFNNIDDCWHTFIGSSCDKKYVKGLGGPYYSCSSDQPLMGDNRFYVYYKKGENTWGTPLTISGIEKEAIANELVKVYPNPCQDILNIRTSSKKGEKVHFLITDTKGRHIIDMTLIEELTKVDLSPLSTGVYIYSLTYSDNTVKSDLLIKH